MTIQRMEHVGIVVDDLAAATEFFVELGLVLQGEGTVEGRWVDGVVGLDGDRPAAASAYAEAARRATNVAERDHLVRQAARARARASGT
jgi:catechol 2,3-dioxygenase-like lactoylglutathione lyase family enzyme